MILAQTLTDLTCSDAVAYAALSQHFLWASLAPLVLTISSCRIILKIIKSVMQGV